MSLETFRPKGCPTPCRACNNFKQPESGWWCGRGESLRRFRRAKGQIRLATTAQVCPWYQGPEIDQPRIHPAHHRADHWRPYAD